MKIQKKRKMLLTRVLTMFILTIFAFDCGISNSMQAKALIDSIKENQKVINNEEKNSMKTLRYDGELTEESEEKLKDDSFAKGEGKKDTDKIKGEVEEVKDSVEDSSKKDVFEENTSKDSKEDSLVEGDSKEDKKEDGKEEIKEEASGDSKEDIKEDKKEDMPEDSKEEIKEDISGEIIKNYELLDVAIVGLLGKKGVELSYESIKETYDKIPLGTGIWIAEKDRKSILELINSLANKEYYVDEEGYLKSTEKIKATGSKLYSENVDKLIASNKVLFVGRSNGWNEYDNVKGQVVRKNFTESNKGITIGGKGTNQLVVIDESIGNTKELSLVLIHELIHGLRGQEGYKDRVEEELYAAKLENEIRKELDLELRDITDIQDTYDKINNIYRDDYNNAAFESTGVCFGTVRLSDPSSSVNVRSGASTSHSVLGSLNHNAQVMIMGKEGNWYKINYNGQLGYVRDDFITLGATGTLSSTGTIKLSDPSSSLNIRSGASTSHSIVGSIGHGAVVQILGKESNWYKIKYNGITGYVRDDFVVLGTISNSTAISGVGTVKLNDPSSSVNIRSGASTSHSIVGSLGHGAKVEIIGKENNWYKIKHNGITGYIREDFITISESGTSNGNIGTIRLNDPSSSLNVRSGASTSHSVIGSITHGSVVQILGKESNWYKIVYNGLAGYVREDFVTLGGSSVSGGSGTGTIRLNDTSSSLNVRSGASTNYSVIGSLRHGATVQILGKENNWYKISFNGTTGYVREDFVTFGGGNGSGGDGGSGTATIRLNDPSSSLNVRSGPSTGHSVIGSLRHGQVIQIIGKESNWYKISINGTTGYVRDDFVAIGTISGSGTGTIRLSDPSSSLNVRSGPSTNHSVVGSLSHGTVVQILGTENGWYKINYNGISGYVRGDFVSLGGSSSVGSDGATYSSQLKEGYIRYYAQDDPRYGGLMYSTHNDSSQTIASSACGPTAFSIVVSTLNKRDIPPTEMCRYALARGFRTYNSGTSSALFSAASSDSANPQYNLNCRSVGNLADVKNLVNDGRHLAIVSMRSGHVTRQGHYIVLSGTQVRNGKVYFKVYDPHRWNEYYIYDDDLIDETPNDGYILLSERAIRAEANSYHVFSDKNNSLINTPNTPSSPSGSGSSNSSTSIGEKITKYMKNTTLGQAFTAITADNKAPGFFDTFGFSVDSNGVYHAKQDGWQKYMGYNDLYDLTFDFFCDMDLKKFRFSTGSEKFVIWMWKGDYLNLGAGAEIGIYYNGGPHWETGVKYSMPMTLCLKDNNGKTIFNWKPTEKNWWCTGFNPKFQNPKASNLTVYGSIDFSNNLDLWDSFYKEYRYDGLWSFDTVSHIANVRW